jgi:hypothetical protein
MEHIGPDQCAIRRDYGTEIMPDYSGHGAVAERRDQAQHIPDKVGEAKRVKVTIVRIIPASSAPVATLIGSDHVISRGCKWKHDFTPAEREFRKAMEKQDAGAILCLKPRLQNMHRETVDVVDNARTDAG